MPCGQALGPGELMGSREGGVISALIALIELGLVGRLACSKRKTGKHSQTDTDQSESPPESLTTVHRENGQKPPIEDLPPGHRITVRDDRDEGGSGGTLRRAGHGAHRFARNGRHHLGCPRGGVSDTAWA